MFHDFDVPTWIVRPFNIAGARQRVATGQVVPAFVIAALKGEPIIVHDDGNQRRSFLHVVDAAQGLISIMESEALRGRPVNLGNTDSIRIGDLARLVGEVLGTPVSIVKRPSQTVFGEGFAVTRDRIPDTRLLRGPPAGSPNERCARRSRIASPIWKANEFSLDGGCSCPLPDCCRYFRQRCLVLGARRATIGRGVGRARRSLAQIRKYLETRGSGILSAMAPWLPLGHLGVLACVTAVGTVDDIGALGPGTKALALAIAAGLAGIVTGSPWVAIAVWVACNATNMLDHADGLAACTIAAAFLGIGGEAGFAGAGAALGFLLFNYPRARVFMGDSGSLLLGAAVVLAASGRGPLVTIGWMAVPLIDAGFVVIRRIRGGRKPWVGGTDHLGHLLLTSGTPGWLLPLLYAGAAFVIGLGVEDLA